METIRYSGGWFWIILFGGSGTGMFVVGVVVVALGNAFALFLVAIGLFGMHTFWSHCYRVELRPDGELTLHYPVRRRTTRAELVRKIEYRKHDEGSDEYVVKFDGGRFQVEADYDSGRLMDALSGLNPSIVLR